jgi:hypothetical protein
MAAKFCCTCLHWEKIAPVSGDQFGICQDVGVAMKVAMDGKTHLAEEGTLWTEAYFGCIYWRENDGSLLSLNDIEFEEDEED